MSTLRVGWIFAASVACCLCAQAAEPPTKRALLIGIDAYENHPPLRGAVRDVDLMSSVLIGRFGFEPQDVRLLKDKDATAEAIRSALTELSEHAGADDVVVVHFSGYGAQLPGDSKELDGLDETLVPVDGKSGGDGEIVDDRLNALMEKIAQRTPNVTLVIDSCYASISYRGGVSDRCLDRSQEGPAQKSVKGFSGVERSEVSKARTKYSLLSAAQSGEGANEAVLGSGPQGVFTYELASALVNLPGAVSWQQAFNRVVPRVRARFPTQEPTFETGDATAPVFHDKSARGEFVAVVAESSTGRVRLAAGQFHGLTPKARFDAFARGTTDFDRAKPLATIDVANVESFTSTATVATRGNVPTGSVVRLDVRGDRTRLSLWFDPKATGKGELAKLREFLRRDPQIVIVDAQTDAQLQVVARDDGYAVLAGDLTPLNHGLRSGDEVLKAVKSWVRWYSVLRLSNPSSALRLKLTLSRDGSTEPLSGPVRPGEVLAYTVTNASEQPLVVQTLILSSDGSIEQSSAETAQLGPGQSARQRLGTFLPDDQRGVTDYIKVFGTNRKVDLTPLTDANRGFTNSMLRDLDWTAEQVSYELRRQTTRVGSFAVHTEVAARSSSSKGARAFGRQALCKPGGGRDCVVGKTLTTDGTLMLVDNTFARSDLEELSAGVAFQQAYDMRAELNAVRVEPLFEVAMGADLPGLEGRSGSSEQDDPLAAKDKLWSLNYIKAPGALGVLRSSLGRTAGREVQGVRIAHLDTGYRDHPELLFKANDYTTLLPASGLDLVDGGDPYDTLATSGLLPNPGHGTASGSVIVSPEGCQLESGAAPCVTGVALGAQLIPVRVHTSVVVFNQARMAEAIFSVAEGRVKDQPRVISIAMGGPPSWTLWRAARAAEGAGLITVAAAGNNVGTVVWPARFESVIAVGAINVRCKPWSGSSQGPRIDISAPGESVWRAQVDRDQYTNVIGMGTGTTFATAATTGAAAMWVAKNMWDAENRETPEFRRLVEAGGVTRAFRRALTASAWRPIAGDANKPQTYCEDGGRWDQSRNGAGILDAERLLAQPLDTAAARSDANMTLADLPLFASLYASQDAAQRAATDYAAIFPASARENIGQFEAEILYHYSTNDVVRGALDRITSGGRVQAEYDRARGALLRVDLSRDLRERLSRT